MFPTRKNRPIAGNNKAKKALDSLMATKSEIGPWSIHELRRSVETSLGKCGSRFVIARMLNHTDSTMTGIYDRHEYPPRSERRSKNGHLEGLVQLPPENLAQMLQRTEVWSAGLSPTSPRVPIGCLPNGREPGQNVSAKLIGLRIAARSGTTPELRKQTITRVPEFGVVQECPFSSCSGPRLCQ